MGCHTWFLRLLTKEEIEEVKLNKAKKHLEELSNCSKCSLQDRNDPWCIDCLRTTKFIYNSIENNTEDWLINGWGFEGVIEKHNKNYYETINNYHDIFRVKYYPNKIIHNLRELRKFLKKDYFKLEQWQIQKLQEFWKEYPKGIISFG